MEVSTLLLKTYLRESFRFGKRGIDGNFGGIPCLGNDYVVEGGISLPEAGEANLDYHYWSGRRWVRERGWGPGKNYLEVELRRAEDLAVLDIRNVPPTRAAVAALASKVPEQG